MPRRRGRGAGPYAVTVESYPTLRDAHRLSSDRARGLRTLEAAADRLVGQRRLCPQRVSAFATFLTQIASHGYLAICDRTEGCRRPRTGTARLPRRRRRSTISMLIDAIDWATKENGDRSSRFYNKIDTTQDCRDGAVVRRPAGARRVARPARHDDGRDEQRCAAGRFESPALAQSAGNKESLKRLHGPIAYIIGGPTDVAYPNAEDDFARITTVPVFKANLNVGHGGTYRQPGGGWFGEVAVAWLDYQLKGSADAAKWFVGADCRLCTEPVWTIEKKGMR